MSKGKKSTKQPLGVLAPVLATAIQENLGIPCRSDDTVRELSRGIRVNFTKFVKLLGNGALEQSQLGLGHAYSRTAVKFNPNRADNMIIQTIALLDQMDKDLNTMAMRVKEWYSWHFPELKGIVSDNYMFARCAAYIKVNILHIFCMSKNTRLNVYVYIQMIINYFSECISEKIKTMLILMDIFVNLASMVYVIELILSSLVCLHQYRTNPN